jgi:hypothetical protein
MPETLECLWAADDMPFESGAWRRSEETLFIRVFSESGSNDPLEGLCRLE